MTHVHSPFSLSGSVEPFKARGQMNSEKPAVSLDMQMGFCLAVSRLQLFGHSWAVPEVCQVSEMERNEKAVPHRQP